MLTPLVVSVTLAGCFALGALIVWDIPPLRDSVDEVSAHAAYGGILALMIARSCIPPTRWRAALLP